MERLDLTPRPNWREDCESVGFTYHSMDGVYWDEAHCYRFSAAQIDELEAATAALHELTLTAIEQIVTTDRFEQLAIPAAFADYVRASWRAREDQPLLLMRDRSDRLTPISVSAPER